MQLNNGWCSVDLKCALKSVIGGVSDNPDSIDVRMQRFQLRKDGSPERLHDETGGLLDADDPDGLHSHRSDGAGLRPICEPTDF